MKDILLLIGGAINVLFGLLHFLLARGIHTSKTLSPTDRALMQMLNVGGICFIFFFAYVSIFCQTELLSTRLGGATIVLVALIYLSRAVEEVIFRQDAGFSLFIFTSCLLVGLLYVSILTPLTGR